MKDDVKTIAARCLDDVAFARQILTGNDYPDVRRAIIADLDDALGSALNPQPLPPGEPGFANSIWVRLEKIWNKWPTLKRTNLQNLTA